MAEVFANAKVNLTLHVIERRTDGYHELDSLVVFADIGDRLRLDDARELSIKVTGLFAQGVPADGRNLAWRAAEAAEARCHIALEKNLPHGSGLGGGSADAAAVLRQYGCQGAAASIGADVSVCLAAGPQRMRGIGNVIERLPAVPACHLVLVNPGLSLPTGRVFGALDQKKRSDMGVLPEWPDVEAFAAWLGGQRNDLEQIATNQVPQVGDVLSALSGAAVVRMTGSGTSCFGLYPDRNSARLAAREISRAHPHWWVRDTVTFGSELS